MRHPVARRRLTALATAGLVMVAALGGCADDGAGEASDSTDPAESAVAGRVAVTDADAAPFDLDLGDVAGAGTPLGGGLSVPEGALLQGAAIPDLVGGGYRALLLVVGDPVQVFDALEAQATSLGMSGQGACLGVIDAAGCTGSYSDGADGESLLVSVDRRVSLAGVVSGASLLYRPPGTGDGSAPDGGSPPPTAPLPPIALPNPVPVPVEEDVAAALRPPGSVPRVLERGSLLVGLPGPCACEGPGWSFVVRLQGIERDVINAYERQFSDLGEPPDIEDTRRDDITIMGVRVGEGSAIAEIRAIVPDTGRSYAMITVRPG